MYGNTRTNQGGSVASFLVVGVVLVAITLGGIFFVQQRNESGRVATSPTPSPSIPGGSPSATQTPPQSSSPSTSSSPKPSASPKPSSSSKPSTSPVPTSHPSTGTAPASDLPATGPTEGLLAVVPAALLIGAIIGYLKSYRIRYGR